jgi:hypothetical protein
MGKWGRGAGGYGTQRKADGRSPKASLGGGSTVGLIGLGIETVGWCVGLIKHLTTQANHLIIEPSNQSWFDATLLGVFHAFVL